MVNETRPINLFLCNSVYQLLNALNLRMRVYGGERADIVVTDICPDHEGLAERLRATGLFETVYAVRAKFIFRQQYKHTMLSVNRWRIDPTSLLKQAGPVPKKAYARYLTAGFDDYISMLYIVLQKKNRQIEHLRFEDGGMSYVKDHACVNGVERRMQKLFRIRPLGSILAPMYLYEPRLYSAKDGRELLQMPKLSPDDGEFINTVNRVFNVSAVEPLKEKAVFFEASYYADGLTTNDRELVEMCHKTLGGELAIKLHPRNGVNRFEDAGIAIMQTDMPWELYCLNNDVSGKTLISVTSNAAISPQLFLEKPPRTVLLYKLFKGTDVLLGIEEYKDYLEKILASCSRISVPETETELAEALSR